MKFCIKCGNSLEDEANRCELCGELQPFIVSSKSDESTSNHDCRTYRPDTPANTQPNYYNQRDYAVYSNCAKSANSSCIAGFVLGIISFFLPIISPVTGIIGLIFSILGVRKTNAGKESGFGFGIAGIIFNSVALLFVLMIILIMVIVYIYADRY